MWCEPLRREEDIGSVAVLAGNFFAPRTAAAVPKSVFEVLLQQRVEALHAMPRARNRRVSQSEWKMRTP